MSNRKSDYMITDMPRVPIDPKRRLIVFVGILLAQFSIMGQFSGVGTILANVLSDIGGMQVYALATVVGTFGFAVMTPVGGKLCDKLGRRNVLLIGALVIFVGSVGLGFSKTPTIFLVFRAIIPFGMGLLQTIPFIITGEIYEPSRIPKMFSILSMVLVSSMFLGGMASGALYDAGHVALGLAWPGIVALAGGMIVFLAMPKENLVAQSEKLDVPGIILMVLVLALFSLVLNCNGFFGGYGSPLIIVAIISTIICLIIFLIVEGKAKNPVVSFKLFKNKIFVGAFLIFFFLPGYSFTYMTYSSIQAAAVLGASGTMIGMLNMGRTIIAVAFSFIIGVLVSREIESRAWKATMIASLLVVLAFLILYTTTPSTSMWVLIGAIALTGFTEGLFGSSVMPLVQRQFSGEEMASGTAIVLVAASIAGTAFANIQGAIFNSLWNVESLIPAKLTAVLTAEQIASLQSAHTLSNPALLDSMSATLSPDMVVLLNQTVQLIKLSLNNAVHAEYLFTVICGFVSFIVAITLLREKKAKVQVNNLEQTATTK